MADINSPTTNRRTAAAERAKQAVNLRIAGATFAQIGERIGVSTQAAHKMVVKHLDETRRLTAESAEQLRDMELKRLDAMQAALWPDAMRGDEQKVDRVIRIMGRRAALLGLDAPAKQEITYTDAELNGAIERELAQLAGRRPAQDAGTPEAEDDAPGDGPPAAA